MMEPKKCHWKLLTRVARCLVRHPRIVSVFAGGPDEAMHISAYSDSDWAGDLITRKSRSGGALTLGGSLVKSWSRRQTIVATSSAEAELYATNLACSEALGLQSLCQDLGIASEVNVYVDASAALGILRRSG